MAWDGWRGGFVGLGACHSLYVRLTYQGCSLVLKYIRIKYPVYSQVVYLLAFLFISCVQWLEVVSSVAFLVFHHW
jgi:hypothetical protein